MLREASNKREASVRQTYAVKPSKIPRRAEINIQQNESLTETENSYATVQTNLDRLGEKDPAPVTPQIFRQSDEKCASYSKRKYLFARKLRETQAGR